MLAAAASARSDAPAWLPVPLFFIGMGQGIALPALVRLNVDQVDARWAGLAAGLVNATLQISAAVSTAVIGGLFFSIASDLGGVGDVKAAFSIAALAIGGCLALAAVLSQKKLAASCSGSTWHEPVNIRATVSQIPCRRIEFD